MHGAYVIKLGNLERLGEQQLTGRVEEVDTGKTARFQTGEELLTFLRQAAASGENEEPS
jgi:hypothetical protein